MTMLAPLEQGLDLQMGFQSEIVGSVAVNWGASDLANRSN
ncbi:hypothetical protein M728_005386 (plasmid) [Ensifer sp. WSM1721]